MAEGGGTLLLAGDRIGRVGEAPAPIPSTGMIISSFTPMKLADNGLQKLQIAEIEWDENGWPVIDEKALNDYRSLLVK